MNLFIFGMLLAFAVLAVSEPTMYKKNDHNVYEADLVAVSSTVFPESEMPNKDEITAEMDMQYKKAYVSLFKKKYNSNLEKADTLMTDKKKFAKSFIKSLEKKTR